MDCEQGVLLGQVTSGDSPPEPVIPASTSDPKAANAQWVSSATFNDLPNELLSSIASFIKLPCSITSEGTHQTNSDLSKLLSARLLSRCVAKIGGEVLRHNFTQVYLHPSPKSITNFKLICEHTVFRPAIEEIVLLGARWDGVYVVWPPCTSEAESLSIADLEALGREHAIAELDLQSYLKDAVASLPKLRSIRYKHTFFGEQQGFNMTGPWGRASVHNRAWAGWPILLDKFRCQLAVFPALVYALSSKNRWSLELFLGTECDPFEGNAILENASEERWKHYSNVFDAFEGVTIKFEHDSNRYPPNIVLNELLKASGLSRISLSSPRPPKDLNAMLREANWARLRKLELIDIAITLELLDLFLERHADTLRDLTLKMAIGNSIHDLPHDGIMPWVRSLTKMRHCLHLERVYVTLVDTGHDINKICRILEPRCKTCWRIRDLSWFVSYNQSIIQRFVFGQIPCGCFRCKGDAGWKLEGDADLDSNKYFKRTDEDSEGGEGGGLCSDIYSICLDELDDEDEDRASVCGSHLPAAD
ncbi:hypothetical protein NA57DRAFT_76505 [Rhizodiscina lignyota]|uniref:Uncharacterized protein n=1 Tax=Rhizodiscina lignyota TaxID=1504668 RepID=A0A9P4IEC0_9PEZI|nr:hypothetical protein NA57DRAFT_76505 [Rhizodiscina lignyota]